MNEIRTKWYGWIPTNRGKINFDFIGLPKNLKSQNVTKQMASEEGNDCPVYENTED